MNGVETSERFYYAVQRGKIEEIAHTSVPRGIMFLIIVCRTACVLFLGLYSLPACQMDIKDTSNSTNI